jgi:hypothetical protein
MHRRSTAGYGSLQPYKDYRDNIGIDHLPAGADSNLQRLSDEVETEGGKRAMVRLMSPYE